MMNDKYHYFFGNQAMEWTRPQVPESVYYDGLNLKTGKSIIGLGVEKTGQLLTLEKEGLNVDVHNQTK